MFKLCCHCQYFDENLIKSPNYTPQSPRFPEKSRDFSKGDALKSYALKSYTFVFPTSTADYKEIPTYSDKNMNFIYIG